MELQFLKKQTRSHKYLYNLTKDDIERILSKYIPRIRRIHVLTTHMAPDEVHDEHKELCGKIVAEARCDLQIAFMKRAKVEPYTDREMALKIWLATL